MGIVRVVASKTIHAPASVVYSILADYRVGHPSILPRRAFLSLDVEEGGYGAGTVIRLRMKAFGATRESRAKISEPTPGQVLVETDLTSGLRTTFDVRPQPGGNDALVTFLTEWTTRGFQGWLEGIFAPGFLRKVYGEELENLAHKAEDQFKSGRSA
jgi:Polyketide cyclase / dehydrase and lipid transport